MPELNLWRTFAGRYAIALVVTIVVTATGVVAVNREIDARVENIARVDVTVATPPPEGANYLLIGSDTREGAICENPIDREAFCDSDTDDGKNSDTLMVAHIEPGAQSAEVVSFPRDLKVEIPNSGSQTAKINSFFSDGGPDAVIEMLKYNFDLAVHHYVEVDFDTFREVVNAIGTVNVYFDHPTRDAFTGLDEPQGCQALDGDEALHYVRSRSMEQQIDGAWEYIGQDAPDLHRIARQQDFIRKLLGVAISRSLGNPFIALAIADDALGFTKLDEGVQRDQVNELIKAFRSVDVNDPNSVRFETVPTAVDPANPLSTLVLDESAGAQEMLDQLRTFGSKRPPPSTVLPSQVKVLVTDAAQKTAADTRAPAVAEALAKNGFQSMWKVDSNADAFLSAVRYGPSQTVAAKLVASYVPDASIVPDPSLGNRVALVLGASFTGLVTPAATTPAGAPDAPTTTLSPGVPSTAAAPTTLPVDPAKSGCE